MVKFVVFPSDSGLRRTVVAVVLMTAVLLQSAPVWSITPISRIAYTEGQVLIKRAGASKPELAQVGDSLFGGDSVVVRRNSRAQVNMSASGIVRLASNSEIRMKSDKSWAVRQGESWDDTRSMSQDDVFEVKTPSLVAGGSEMGHIHARHWKRPGDGIDLRNTKPLGMFSARVAGSTGPVYVRRKGQARPTRLQPNDGLLPGDRIETGKGGSAVLITRDGELPIGGDTVGILRSGPGLAEHLSVRHKTALASAADLDDVSNVLALGSASEVAQVLSEQDQEAMIVTGSVSAPSDLLDKFPSVHIERTERESRNRESDEVVTDSSEQESQSKVGEPEQPGTRPSAAETSARESKATDHQQQAGNQELDRKQRKEREKELMKKAERMASAGIVPKDSYDSVPVIPENATIDFVVWHPDHPDNKSNHTLYIQNGVVSMSGKHTIESTSHSAENYSYECNQIQMEWSRSGRLQGNQITSTGTSRYLEPWVCVESGRKRVRVGDAYQFRSYRCESRYMFRSEWSDTMTLNIDGTFVTEGTSTGYPDTRKTGDTDYCSSVSSDPYQTSGITYVGIWTLRGAANSDG